MAGAPLDAAEARQLINRTKAGVKLKGYRGKPALHEASVIKAIVGLSNLMADAGNRIASIDVNPFLINTKLGVAVDGLIVLNNAAAKNAAKDAAEARQHGRDAMKLKADAIAARVRYEAEGEPMMKAQCHCRECQYITGGSPNMFVVMPVDGFKYTKGAPKQFTRKDLEKRGDARVLRRMRHPCRDAAAGPAGVVLKVGTLDEPDLFDSRRWRSSPSTSRPSTISPRACRVSSGCRSVSGHSASPRPLRAFRAGDHP